MAGPTRGGIATLRFGAFALLASLGIVASHPVLAQTRSLALLSDVQALMPAPYHPHSATAAYSAALYDGQPYYGGVYQGGGAHYWH